MADGTIDQANDNGISLIEFNHPPVNSYTHEMLREFDDALLMDGVREVENGAVSLEGDL